MTLADQLIVQQRADVVIGSPAIAEPIQDPSSAFRRDGQRVVRIPIGSQRNLCYGRKRWNLSGLDSDLQKIEIEVSGIASAGWAHVFGNHLMSASAELSNPKTAQSILSRDQKALLQSHTAINLHPHIGAVESQTGTEIQGVCLRADIANRKLRALCTGIVDRAVRTIPEP